MVSITLSEFAPWLFAQECIFLQSAQKLDQLPIYSLPEVAFIGRSNVGKSSLINALTNQLSLARTSHTPGRTQQLIFFEIRKYLIIVDMPGYGYARAPKNLIREWNFLIKDYLIGRPTLTRLYLLIDSRHGLKEKDKEIMKTLDGAAVSYQVVLTKTDKISASSLETIKEETNKILGGHPACHPLILQTSAQKKEGIKELREEISSLVISSGLDKNLLKK